MKSFAALVTIPLVLVACSRSHVESRQPSRGSSRQGAAASTASALAPRNAQPAVELESGAPMRITSRAFADRHPMPADYTCDGRASNPPLSLSDVPPGTKSFALIVDDPDAPGGTWDHWIVWNIPPQVSNLAEGQRPPGVTGRNSWARNEWGAPCPPAGEHRYVFKIYALDTMLQLDESSGKAPLERAMKGHILASGTLTGVYERRKQ